MEIKEKGLTPLPAPLYGIHRLPKPRFPTLIQDVKDPDHERFPLCEPCVPNQAMLNYVQEMEAEEETPRNMKTWMILKTPWDVHSNPPSYAISTSHSQKGVAGEWKCSENPNDRFEISSGVLFSPLHPVVESSFHYE